MVGRSWHAEHVCSLNLTFICNNFWNKGRKVLKCWKFDEKKGNNSKIDNKCRVGRSWHVAHFCNLNLTSIFYNCWNIRRKVLKCWKFDEKREIAPK